LREIASRTWDADSVDEVYALSARALACDPRDMPFAMVYGLEADGMHARLHGHCGIEPGHPAAPEIIALDRGSLWPISDVVRGGRRAVPRLGDRFADLPKGPWNDAAQEALMLPLSVGADAAPRGVLILAANPYRRRGDDSFENFAALVARQIAAAAVNIETHEAERERAKSADSLALEIEHRRRIERHQNLLLDELNHRVKNTLATVQAMATQSLKDVEPGPRDTFLARLFALSSQHDLLTLDNWEGASLEGVVRRALRPWREAGGPARFKVEGPAVHLNPKRALALGMVFHELATNAARHGALSNEAGMVKVSWTLESEAWLLRLRWEEEGGPKVREPQRRGFGLRLIQQGLEREVAGKVMLDFRPEGVVCEWDMKLV
jgi:two-component sensor histidine kinase